MISCSRRQVAPLCWPIYILQSITSEYIIAIPSYHLPPCYLMSADFHSLSRMDAFIHDIRAPFPLSSFLHQATPTTLPQPHSPNHPSLLLPLLSNLGLPSTSLKSVKSTAFTRWKSQHPRPHTSQLRHRSQTLAFTIPLQHQAGGLRRRYPLLTGRHCLPTAVSMRNHGES